MSNESVDHPLVRCKECKLIYLNPRPTEREIISIYKINYHRPQGQKLTTSAGERYQKRMMIAKKQAAVINKTKCCGRLLDVGCGNGYLLKVMSD